MKFSPLLDRISKSKRNKLKSRMDELKLSFQKRMKEVTVEEKSQQVFDDVYKVHTISTRLQKMKKLGIISNVKDSNNVCYWGLEKKYRQHN